MCGAALTAKPPNTRCPARQQLRDEVGDARNVNL